MQNLKLTLGDPLCLTLAADARTSPVNYPSDIIWKASLGSGTPSALSLESNLGLRVNALRIFFRFLRQDNDLLDPLEFAIFPSILQQLPGYLHLQAQPFIGIQLDLEFWIAASSIAAGRINLRNDTILPESIRLQLCAQLLPLESGNNFIYTPMDASTALVGKADRLEPAIFITGGPQNGSGPYPNLELPIDLQAGDQRQLTWAIACLPEAADSFQLARLTTARSWDAEITRAELTHFNQAAHITTPDPDWNSTLHLGQVAAARLLMPASKDMPQPFFVLGREPEHGFSRRGDGSDYSHLWSGVTVLDAWYLAGLLLPGAPELIRGLVNNFLTTADTAGWIDFKPGLTGQRSQRLAQPILASLAWRVQSAAPNPAWIKRIYPRLMAFVRHWLSEAHDRHQSGYPSWDHPLQTGLEQAPLYDRWHITSQAVDIHSLDSPALASMLYRECRSLIEMARLIKNNLDISWLEEQAAMLREHVESLWSEAAATYRYHDVHTHQSLKGSSLLEFTHSGKYRLRRKFSPPRRVQLVIQSQADITCAVSIRIYGQGQQGEEFDEIDLRTIHWVQGMARAVSSVAFSAIESVEITGLRDEDRGSLYTADYTVEDISLLLPLWAGIPSAERAHTLIEKTILPRYLQPYGLSTCPASSFQSVNPELGCALLPWNDLICEGLLRYGFRDLAAECFTRLMRSVITTLKQDQSFRTSLCSTDQPSAGERNVLSALPPVNLFWELLGVSRITPNEVILQNHCPLPGPITVQYQGMDITFQSKSSVVRFSNLESVTVTKPGLRRVHR